MRFNGIGDGVFEGDNANQGHGLDQIYRPMEIKAKKAKTIIEVEERVDSVEGRVQFLEDIAVKKREEQTDAEHLEALVRSGVVSVAAKTQMQPQVTTTEIFH